MNMFKKLPYFVIIDNIKYKINVDFREIISLEKILQDKTIKDDEKVKKIICRFYPFFYNKQNYTMLMFNMEHYKKLCEKFIWFYKCGREDYHKQTSGEGGKSYRSFDYDYDDEYIFSAFKQYYNIDLTEDNLHWWKFKAMLKALPSECEFVKIQGYRTYNGDDDNMKKLKKYWELPISPDEKERLKALYEALK